MSFSNNVKGELSKLPLGTEKEMISELSALMRVNGVMMIQSGKMKVRFSTENNPVARRIFQLVKTLYHYDAKIIAVKRSQLRRSTNYRVFIEEEDIVKRLLEDTGYESSIFIISTGEIPERLISTNMQIRAYMRGCFLGAGSITNPEKMYHMEIVFHEERDALSLKNIMNKVHLRGKITQRKEQFIFYFKDSELISDCLSFMQAYQSVLKFEDVRAMKNLKNNINRVINCETANIDKTVAAAMKQREAIEIIGLENLPDDLKQIARIRLANPDLSLKEIGERSNPKITKSGVNYKLKKIEKMAQKLTERSL